MTIEHGQLFKGEMVRAILDGRKNQTRRVPTASNSLVDGRGMSAKRWGAMGFDWAQAVLDHGPSPAGNEGPYWKVPSTVHGTWHRVYPRVQAGHALWVRETTYNIEDHGWQGPLFVESEEGRTAAAWGYGESDDPDFIEPFNLRQRPGIHMKREWARLVLPVLAVRAERLQQISEADAWDEGLLAKLRQPPREDLGRVGRDLYFELWDAINGPESRAANPPVWIYDFPRQPQGVSKC